MNKKTRPGARATWAGFSATKEAEPPNCTGCCLADQAIWYAENGYPVLPVEPFGKRPLIRNWPTEATSNSTTVAFWWSEWPDANIGIATGHAFDVLDVDDVAAFREAIPAHVSIPIGPHSFTARGIHFLFQPTGQGKRAGFMPGADWRGKGGFIVAPPSLHPSGHRYCWGVGPSTALPAVPGWIREQLEPPRLSTPPRACYRPLRTPNRYGRAALRREARALALAAEGERNDTLNRGAFRLGQLVAGGVLDAGTVADVLMNTAVGVGLGEREAEATIASGLRAGQRSPRGAAS